jgi:hypothetical protein
MANIAEIRVIIVPGITVDIFNIFIYVSLIKDI